MSCLTDNSSLSGHNGRFLAIAVCAVAAIAAGIGFYFFPWIADDIQYRQHFAAFYNDGASVSPADIWNTYLARYFNDNARGATLAMLILQFLPEPITAIISSTAYFFSLRLILRLAGLENSPAAAAAIVFAFAVFMPWVDQMYLFDFQLPYLVGGTAALWFIFALLYRRGSNITFWALSLFVGLWQECFGFPIFAGMTALMLLYPRFRDRRTIVSLLIILAGLAFLYTAPGRAHYQVDIAVFRTRFNIVIVFLLPAVVYLLSSAAVFIKDLMRRHRPQPKAVMMTVACAASAWLSAYAAFGPRVGWLSATLAFAGMLAIAHPLIASRPWLKKTAGICAAAAFFFFMVHICYVDYYSYKQRREYDTVISQYRTDPDSPIYTAMILRHQAPLLCLQKPYFGIFSHYFHLQVLSRFYGSEEHFMRVLPIELQTYDHTAAQHIGDTPFTVWGGHIVGPKISDKPERLYVTADYGKGPADCNFMIMPFTDPQGIQRAWYSADASSLTNLITPIPLYMEETDLSRTIPY